MSEVVLVAVIVGAFGTVNALIVQAGHKKLLVKQDEQLVETAKVHDLVNSRSKEQDVKIAGLLAEVAMLRRYIAKEDS